MICTTAWEEVKTMISSDRTALVEEQIELLRKVNAKLNDKLDAYQYDMADISREIRENALAMELLSKEVRLCV